MVRVMPSRSANSRAGWRVWVLLATTIRRLTSGVKAVVGIGAPRLASWSHMLTGRPSTIGSPGAATRWSGSRCGVRVTQWRSLAG